ncbi:MAG: serine hydrolase domain-containing protein, partial [Myxococcota bacterium]
MRAKRRHAAVAVARVVAAAWLAAAATGLAKAGQPSDDGLAAAVERAAQLEPLHALIVARDGRVLVEERFRGPSLDTPVNVKSVSKSIVSALVGKAIAEGHLEGASQRILPFFRRELPADPDPRKARITIGHLLSMRSGLERTSGRGYGRWVATSNWVRHAIRQPMTDPPGDRMMYSTGNTHLLSAILTRA